MKYFLLFFAVVFAFCGDVFAQKHSFQDDRSIMNYNYNWDKAHVDSVVCPPGKVTVLLLSGEQSGYNMIVQPVIGDVKIKLSGSWPHWWTVFNGSPLSVSGGELDTLFLTSGAPDTAAAQVMWTSFK